MAASNAEVLTLEDQEGRILGWMIWAKLLDLHGPRFEINGRSVSVKSSVVNPCNCVSQQR